MATLRLRIKTLEEKNRELTELLERAYKCDRLDLTLRLRHNFRVAVIHHEHRNGGMAFPSK